MTFCIGSEQKKKNPTFYSTARLSTRLLDTEVLSHTVLQIIYHLLRHTVRNMASTSQSDFQNSNTDTREAASVVN